MNPAINGWAIFKGLRPDRESKLTADNSPAFQGWVGAQFKLISPVRDGRRFTPASSQSARRGFPAFRQRANVAQAFGHDAEGGGNTGFAENSPAIYGWVNRHQHKISPGRDGRTILPSLTGLGTLPNREPSHEWLGYFQTKINCFKARCSDSFRRDKNPHLESVTIFV